MNLGEIRDYIYKAAQADPRRGIWEQSQVDNWIHYSHMQFHQMVAAQYEQFCYTTSFINEVLDQEEYSLPSNMYRLLMVERLLDDDTYQPLNKEVLNENLRKYQGGPLRSYYRPDTSDTYYIVGQRQLVIVRGSPKTLTNGLKLHYIFRPEKMTEDRHLPLQSSFSTPPAAVDDLSEWHDIIPLGVLPKVFAQEEDYNKAQFWDNQYERRKQELRQHLIDTAAQSARRIHVTSEEYL